MFFNPGDLLLFHSFKMIQAEREVEYRWNEMRIGLDFVKDWNTWRTTLKQGFNKPRSWAFLTKPFKTWPQSRRFPGRKGMSATKKKSCSRNCGTLGPRWAEGISHLDFQNGSIISQSCSGFCLHFSVSFIKKKITQKISGGWNNACFFRADDQGNDQLKEMLNKASLGDSSQCSVYVAAYTGCGSKRGGGAGQVQTDRYLWDETRRENCRKVVVSWRTRRRSPTRSLWGKLERIPGEWHEGRGRSDHNV